MPATVRSMEALAPTASAKATTIGVDRLFVFSGGVVRLLRLQFEEQRAVNALHLSLGHPPLPDGFERTFEDLTASVVVDLVDKRDILITRKDGRELLLGGGENVVYAVDCTVDDLDVLHNLFARLTWGLT